MLRPEEGIVVLEFRGEHDARTERELGDLLSLLVRGSTLVVADLSEVAFVDSSFMRNLILANKLAEENDVTFRVQLGKGSPIQAALEIGGITSYLDCSTSREQALSGSRF